RRSPAVAAPRPAPRRASSVGTGRTAPCRPPNGALLRARIAHVTRVVGVASVQPAHPRRAAGCDGTGPIGEDAIKSTGFRGIHSIGPSGPWLRVRRLTARRRCGSRRQWSATTSLPRSRMVSAPVAGEDEGGPVPGRTPRFVGRLVQGGQAPPKDFRMLRHLL